MSGYALMEGAFLAFQILIVFYFVLWALIWISVPFGLIDTPSSRKRHRENTPVVGGIAIYLMLFGLVAGSQPPEEIFWLVVSAGFLVGVGAADDMRGLKVLIRFLVQLFGTSLMCLASSLWIGSLGLAGLDSLEIWIAIPFTVLAVVGLINAMNMADGLDGLASGYVLVALACFYGACFLMGFTISNLGGVLIFALLVLAFWVVNMSLTKFPKVFLGDAGSYLLGFILAWLLIYHTQVPGAIMPPVAAIWVTSIPVYDMLTVSFKRIKAGRSPMRPDRNHLHHLLIDIGVSPRATLFFILTFSAFLSVTGLFVAFVVSPLASLFLYLACLMGFGYITTRNSLIRMVMSQLKLIK